MISVCDCAERLWHFHILVYVPRLVPGHMLYDLLDTMFHRIPLRLGDDEKLFRLPWDRTATQPIARGETKREQARYPSRRRAG
eukprot:6467551-Amphidinium_carterae.1